jgi:hypothetical protein
VLGENRWRFEVADKEITVAISTVKQRFPSVKIRDSRKIDTPTQNGKIVQLYDMYYFSNSNIFGWRPKYNCNVTENRALIDRDYAPSFFRDQLPERERIGSFYHPVQLRARRADAAAFKRIVGIDKKPRLTVGKWQELHGYLREAIEFKRASQSSDKS